MSYPLFVHCIIQTTGYTPKEEYRFHPKRRWRFDLAIPELKVAIEIEGGIWTGGRHTRGTGYQKDMEKYNAAQMLGWKVFRYTPQQLDECIADMQKLLRD
jgi:very-short-patch-repair endonuclease